MSAILFRPQCINMYCFIIINAIPIYCTLRSAAVGVTLVCPWSLVVSWAAIGATYGSAAGGSSHWQVFSVFGVCTLQWRHPERDDVSNHQRLRCLPHRWSMRRSKKTLSFPFPLPKIVHENFEGFKGSFLADHVWWCYVGKEQSVGLFCKLLLLVK